MKIKDSIIASCDEAALGFGCVPVEEPAGPPEHEDQTLVRADEVERMTTLDRATILRKVQNESFPAPVQLSERRYAWARGDVLRWLATCRRGWNSF
jgi:predicted DNA-binding transcriptional regulator AlpA